MEFVLLFFFRESASAVSRFEFSTFVHGSMCVRVSQVYSRTQAHVDTGDTTLQMGCIRIGRALLAVKSVTQAQLGTDESPTRDFTAAVLRGSRCLAMSQLLLALLAKRFAHSHFVML